MSFIYRAKPEGIPDIRQYMRECRLPSLAYAKDDPILPPPGHTSHRNHLSVRPETYRRLESIYGINDDVWLALERCLDQQIPTRGLRINQRNFLTGHGLTIPTSLPDSYPWNLDKRPDHIHRFIPWIDRLPFTTVKRLLHLSIPETREWSFTPAVTDQPEPDSDIFCCYTWSQSKFAPSGPKVLEDAADRRVLVAMQPPWILTARDLKAFANSRSFPPFLLPGHDFPEELETSKDRLWAKVWDSCVRKRINYFVVTSYTHWVFGYFTEDYTAAFTSSVFEFNSSTPTIVEMLSYWVISSMHLPGGHEIEVGSDAPFDPSFFQTPSTVFDLLSYGYDAVLALAMIRPHECADPEDSVSDWGGRTVGSYEESAGVRFGSVFTSTGGGVVERTTCSAKTKNRPSSLEQWVAQRVVGKGRSITTEDVEMDERRCEAEEELPFVVEVFFDPRKSQEEARNVGQWLY